MNSTHAQNQDQITIQFNRHISISRQSLKLLLAEFRPENPPIVVVPPPQKHPPQDSKEKQLTYKMREAAQILGVSYITVHRLVKRRFPASLG